MFDRLQPETLVLEAFDQRFSDRQPRVARLCRAIVALAADRGVDIAIYTKKEVASAFGPVGARSRQEIAEAVARHIEPLRHRLPARRKPWQCEDRRLSLFSAAALILTHFQLSSQRLLDDLAAA
jgi:Holliday junction resolvasome RuvABC endonuclease subunit